MLSDELAALVARCRADLSRAATPADVEEIRRAHTGKRAPLRDLLARLRELSADERPSFARAVQEALAAVESDLSAASVRIDAEALDRRLRAEAVDLSLPPPLAPQGSHNPVTLVERHLAGVMRQLGFQVVDGPEVEHPWYNFDALNIPEHHPARDMQDTFWVTDGWLLRSHTTTIQARLLSRTPEPPVRVVAMGRAYRNEAVDATHLAMFHQFEGIWVDRGLTFVHLRGTLAFLARSLYGDRPIRFKPKFYPYTEPSAGLDVACTTCEGAGQVGANPCEACHGAGWVTILGAGLIHPRVLRGFGYDPDTVSGIAFGMGTSRMAAQWAGTPRIRGLYEADLRVHRALSTSGAQ